MTFQLINDTDYTKFNMSVNNFLKDGWELYGDTKIVIENAVTHYYQTMVKD